jgi:hypothetical protein
VVRRFTTWGQRSTMTIEPVQAADSKRSPRRDVSTSALAIGRLAAPIGNVGPLALAQTRESLAVPSPLPTSATSVIAGATAGGFRRAQRHPLPGLGAVAPAQRVAQW